MSTFDESTVRRQPQGVTSGGQFATQPKSEADVSLGAPSPAEVRVDVTTSIRLSTDLERDVPEFPASLGTPELSYDRDAESDDITLAVSTERTGVVQFWSDGNTVDFGGYEGDELSGDERDALIAYGEAVRTNVDVLAFNAEYILRSSVQDTVVAIASGGELPTEEGTNAERASARAERVLRAWVDDVDTDPETALRDALTDLTHFARSRGIDIDDLVDAAAEVADEEDELDS